MDILKSKKSKAKLICGGIPFNKPGLIQDLAIFSGAENPTSGGGDEPITPPTPTEWVQTTDWRNDGITDISISNYNRNRTVRLKGSLDSIYAVGVTEDHSLSNYVTIDECDEYKSVECGYVTLKFSSGIRVKSVDLYMEAHDIYYYQGIDVMFRDTTGGSGTTLYKKSLDWYTYENNSSNETTEIEINLKGHHNYKSTYLYGIRLHAEFV